MTTTSTTPDATVQPLGRHIANQGSVTVYQFGVAVRIKDQVFWFEIAVDDAAVVQVDESLDSACRVEPRRRVVECVPIHHITQHIQLFTTEAFLTLISSHPISPDIIFSDLISAVKRPSSPWLRPVREDGASYFVLIGRSQANWVASRRTQFG